MADSPADPSRVDTDAAPLNQPTLSRVQCRFCREEIDPAASLCRYCRSDLTWRRHLPLGQTGMAILTALIAVSAAVGPQIRRLLRPDDSAIQVRVISSDQTTLTLLASNGGSQIGALTGAYIDVRGLPKVPGEYHVSMQRVPTLVEPDKTIQATLKLSSMFGLEGAPDEKVFSTYPDAMKAASQATCELSVEGVSSRGVEFTIKSEVDCMSSPAGSLIVNSLYRGPEGVSELVRKAAAIRQQ